MPSPVDTILQSGADLPILFCWAIGDDDNV